jgi:DNA-binding protein YbaB
MRQAQQAQEAMKRVQDELARTEITGEAGGGMVKITLNGKHEAKRVEIAAAINDASQKLERNASEKMAKVAGGLNLPAGFNLGG